jgi:hypothetical protein
MFDKPIKLGWDKNGPFLRLSVQRASDPDSLSTYNYDLMIGPEELASILEFLADRVPAESLPDLASKLAPQARALVRLTHIAAGIAVEGAIVGKAKTY